MFMGFLIDTQVKADTKMSVVMWCQIFDRKSIVPSSGDFCRQLPPVDKINTQRRKNYFLVNCLLDPLFGHGRSFACSSLRELFISCPPCFLADSVAGVHHYIFFNETSWRLVVNRNKLRLDLSYQWDFFLLKKLNSFQRNAELN